jgi:hypothetical protein
MYTFNTGITVGDGNIGIGADEAATQAAILAALDGSDNQNTPNTDVTASAWNADVLTLTATVYVASGGAATTSFFSHGSNLFNGVILGSTTSPSVHAALEVPIGVDAAASALNAWRAIKGTDGSNAVDPDVTTVTMPTASTIAMDALLLIGTAGDALISTDTFAAGGANGFTGVTFAGGAELEVGEIALGDNVAATKVAIVAAILGTDTVNTTHTTVSVPAAFTSDTLVLTAIVAGAAGNAIDTTTDMGEGADAFDDTTLGTTTLGDSWVDTEIPIGTGLLETLPNIIAAVNGTDGVNTANPKVVMVLESMFNRTMTLTAVATGAAGNAWVTTETFDEVTNIFDATSLGDTTLGVTAVPWATTIWPIDDGSFIWKVRTYLNHNFALILATE